MEKVICKCSSRIGQVFFRLWAHESCQRKARTKAGAGAKAAAAKKRIDPGKAEDEEFKEKQRKNNSMACELATSTLFMAMVHISFTAKRPMVRFMTWLQKAVAEQAKSRDAEPFGPTPLSKLVEYKGDVIRRDMVALLDLEHDMEAGFGKAWPLVPEHLLFRARELAVTLIMTMITSWDFRFTKKLSSLPMMILVLCQKPPHECHPRRAFVAGMIRQTPDDDLKRQSPFSDVPIKMKHLYPRELEEAHATGTCPFNLYLFVLILRARLPCESQEVEGVNSVLQSGELGTQSQSRLGVGQDQE